MNHQAIPVRVRAKIGKIDEAAPGHEEFLNKWVFTVWVFTLDEKENFEVGTFGPFETKQEAEKASRIEGAKIAKMISQEVSGQPSGFVFDMREGGRLRSAIDFIERGPSELH